MDSDGYYWFDSPSMEDRIDEDGPDEDNEESRTESPSLPSLPLSLQEQLACPEMGYSAKNQAMSMKEIDAKLNTLRTENFDLKLRLFYERQNKGGRRPDGDSFIAKEFDRLEKSLQEYKRIIAAKDHQIDVLEIQLEEAKCVKHCDCGLVRKDLLIVSDQLDGSNGHQTTRRLSSELVTSANNNSNNNSKRGNGLLDEFDLADKEKREYMRHRNILRNIPSESEEEWSEPDRSVSKSRIGIETCTEMSTFDAPGRVPLKSRQRTARESRLSSLEMSSLNLLSGFNEFINGRQRAVNTLIDLNDEETQTDIGVDDLEELICYYHQTKFKTFESCPTQTGKDLSDQYMTSKACQTVPSIKSTNEHGIQTESPEIKYDEKSVETEILQLVSVSSQTVQQSTIEKGVQFAEVITPHSEQPNHQLHRAIHHNQQRQHQTYHPTDMKTLHLSPSPSTKDNKLVNNNQNCDHNVNKPIFIKSSSPPQPSLCTYKTTLTPMTKPMFKNVDYSDCEYFKDEVESKIILTPKLGSRSQLNRTKNDPRSILNKTRYTSIDEVAHERSIKSNQIESTIENDSLTSKKSSKISPSYSSSKIFDIINNQLKENNKENKGQDSFSDNLHDHHHNKTKHNHCDRTPEQRLSGTTEDSENNQLSSPDLGIGDSDQDVNSTLRAYISLGHYQLLRGNLNQLSSYLDSFDNFYRDCFLLQSINLPEYSTGTKSSLNNLHQIVNSSRSICKNFAIEDENSISLQLEKIKAKKESMEKAITRQLRKTDKLLRKAKLNLKDS